MNVERPDMARLILLTLRLLASHVDEAFIDSTNQLPPD
jgi:hypothetical protein